MDRAETDQDAGEASVSGHRSPNPLDEEHGKVGLGYTLMVGATFLWGGAWITARLAAEGDRPFSVTTGRYMLATLALFPAWWLLERRRVIPFSRADWWNLCGMALTGMIGYNLLFLFGVRLAPASDGVLLVPGLSGFFGLLFISLQSRASPGARAWVGSALAVGGAALVGLSSLQASVGGSRPLGDALFVLTAVAWGLFTLFTRRSAPRIPPITGVLVASAIAGFASAPLALFVDGVPRSSDWSPVSLVNLVYLGVASSALATTFFNLALKHNGIQRLAPMSALVPMFGVLGATTILHERLTIFHAIGGTLIVAGIVVSGLPKRRSATPPVDVTVQPVVSSESGKN